MATKNKSKNSSRKSSKRLKFKFNRIQALAVIILLIVVGVIVVYKTHAANAVPATYVVRYPNCGHIPPQPLCHTTGYWQGDFPEVISGKTQVVPIWIWPNGSLKNNANYDYQTSHYFQYGPYSNVTMPSNKTGLQVCYYIAGWGNIDDGNGYLQLSADVNYNGLTKSNAITWYQPELKTRTDSESPVMSKECRNFPLQKSKTYTGVEYRLRVISTTDKDAQLNLWKTSVAFY